MRDTGRSFMQAAVLHPASNSAGAALLLAPLLTRTVLDAAHVGTGAVAQAGQVVWVHVDVGRAPLAVHSRVKALHVWVGGSTAHVCECGARLGAAHTLCTCPPSSAESQAVCRTQASSSSAHTPCRRAT